MKKPYQMKWSEQTKIEAHAPAYLRNAIRIITETGLRIYKELAPMKKEQVDLANQVIFIADSKTPTGVAEVPLTDIAAEAFRSQMELAFQKDLGADAPEGRCPLFPNLRPPLHLRHAAECGRRGRRVGDAASPADGRQGV